ncbi:MAG: DUF4910 domain-containing protein [Candidatus Hodarchaeales archaeon]|jgi:hypothetical protein
MNISRLVDIFTNEFSTQSIMDNISKISQYHRIQGSLGFLDSVKDIQSILKDNGVSSIINEYPADGKWNSWDWTSPISWDIKSGECWLIKPFKKRLCRFIDHPMSVLTHSKAADFEGILVDVGTGEKPSDFEAANGKIALITAGPRSIFSHAAKHNVKGLVYHPNLNRAAQIGDSTIQYDGFWPVAENLSDVTSGFSISHAQARELQQYLKSNKEVKLHFKIDAHFSKENGKLHVLESSFIGKEKPLEEIVMIAHLCHPSPGANDNASGSATLLEIVLSLNRMIQTEQIEHPKRTLRFLWVPEFSGTIPWLTDYDQERVTKGRKIISVLNLDMVGESPKTVGTPLSITSPSISTPSYLIGMLKYVSEIVKTQKVMKDGWTYQLNYLIQPFAGGSDHLIFSDNHFSIPGVMFGHDDPYHHSSADSIDKVEPLECRSVGVISSVIAYALGTSDPKYFKEILPYVFSEIIEGISIVEQRSNQSNELSRLLQQRQRDLVEERSVSKLKSVLELNKEKILKEEVDYFVKMVEKHFNHLNQIPREIKGKDGDETVSDKTIIKRNYVGPLSFKRMMTPNRSVDKQAKLGGLVQKYLGGVILELLNLTNGKLNVEDIYLLLKGSYPELRFDDITFVVNLLIEEEIILKI